MCIPLAVPGMIAATAASLAPGASTALSLGGAGLGALGAIMGGNQNEEAARQQAAFAAVNAKMAMTEASGRVGQIDSRVSAAIGATRANFGASGIDVSSGSPVLLQALSAANGNIDKQLTIAQGLNQSAGQNEAAGEALRRGGDAQVAGWLGAGTALLRGIGSIRGLGGYGPQFSIGMGS